MVLGIKPYSVVMQSNIKFTQIFTKNVSRVTFGNLINVLSVALSKLGFLLFFTHSVDIPGLFGKLFI